MNETVQEGSGLTRDPVAKAISVMGWMVDAPGKELGVREIARGLGLPPSTVHRVLSDLAAQGLVRVDHSTGRYSLGLELYRLAWKITSRFPLREIALPTLEELVRQCDETAFLAAYDPIRREAMFAATVESAHELRYVLPLNRWGPLYLGSSGLAILAFVSVTERQSVFAKLRAASGRRAAGARVAELQTTLAKVRRQGYARTTGQRTAGAVGISAPVFASGGVTGSVGLTIPVTRFTSTDESRLAKLVVDAAQQVTRHLGGTSDGMPSRPHID